MHEDARLRRIVQPFRCAAYSSWRATDFCSSAIPFCSFAYRVDRRSHRGTSISGRIIGVLPSSQSADQFQLESGYPARAARRLGRSSTAAPYRPPAEGRDQSDPLLPLDQLCERELLDIPQPLKQTMSDEALLVVQIVDESVNRTPDSIRRFVARRQVLGLPGNDSSISRTPALIRRWDDRVGHSGERAVVYLSRAKDAEYSLRNTTGKRASSPDPVSKAPSAPECA